MKIRFRSGGTNSLGLLAIASIVVVAVLVGFLFWTPGRATPEGGALFMHCAAGMREPVEIVARQYAGEPFGARIDLNFQGSNTLLSAIEESKTGDLYLSADKFYMDEAVRKGLVKEAMPIGFIRPVVAVKPGNPKNIQSIDDLLRSDVRLALANPGAAAVGRKTRKLLKAAGRWDEIEKHAVVFKPTVNDVATDVQLGHIDAGIVWDSTTHLTKGIDMVRLPELDKGTSQIMIGVLASAKNPTAALRFARYITARDKGLGVFKQQGFEVVEGDKWAQQPQLTFFCGSVNRRAVEGLIKEFESREGVQVNTIYNGCGILTAQMRTIAGGQQGQGFPDTYMACDRYYLETVKEMFQEDVDISDTAVVIAVPKGNPKNIQNLADLIKPGMRVSLGQPDQCTIGVLTRQLLESEGVLDDVMKNVVTQTPSSAMLVPTVTTGSVDATLAFATDTRAEADKVDTVRVNSAAATAIQPFSISRSSDHKYLARRLFQAIADAKHQFEAAGFHWRLSGGALNTNTAGE